ncbi:MAG: hypothetical protein QF464_17780, partial [Myxococcota bacterium]|nr:hypothetical protein [Myxococcota bacterium]
MHRVIIPFALALLLLSAPTSAKKNKSGPSGEAATQALHDLGTMAYAKGQYEVAADAFRKALEQVDHPALMWNLARSEERAGRLAEARDTFRTLMSRQDLTPEIRTRGADDLVRVVLKLREREESAERFAREETLRGELDQLRKELQAAEASAKTTLIGRLSELDRLEQELLAERRRATQTMAERVQRHRGEIGQLRETLAAAIDEGDKLQLMSRIHELENEHALVSEQLRAERKRTLQALEATRADLAAARQGDDD